MTSGSASRPLYYARRMEPEAPPTAPRPVSDESRDSQIIREHRHALAGELSALTEDQGKAGCLRLPGDGEGSCFAGEPKRK